MGRGDKKFCSTECRSRYHKIHKSLPKEDLLYIKDINRILNSNRTIIQNCLKEYESPKLRIPRIELDKKGFKFEYCTRTYLNSKGKWIKYIYEYRWIEFSDQYVVLYA